MPAKRAARRTKEMDLRAGLAPASAVYETAASLPMLAENEKWPFGRLRAGPQAMSKRSASNGCRGMIRTCIRGFRDRCPTR